MTRANGATALARARRLAMALPEAHEVVAWGEPTFRVRNKMFAMFASAESHHGGGRPALWIKGTAANQGAMVADAPDRFFVPPYVGPSGWIGVWLDRGCDWRELALLLRDGWRLAAPKRLVALESASHATSSHPTGDAPRPPRSASPKKRPRSS